MTETKPGGTGMREALYPVSRCLAFFAAVIKSGEPWTETCQQEYNEARAALSSTGDERREALEEALAMALPLIERHAPKDDCDEYTATVSFIRSLLRADGGEKP